MGGKTFGTYLITFVDITPRQTEKLTMMLGSVMMEALALAGKYSERMTPSHGSITPTRNSYPRNAKSDAVNDDVPSPGATNGTTSNIADTR